MSFVITQYDAPRFASRDGHPFDTVSWSMGTYIKEETGQELVIEKPDTWSENACSKAATIYLRRKDIPYWAGAGSVPPVMDGQETSIKQLIHRVAYFISHNNYILGTNRQVENYYLDLCYLLLHQIIGFNTPAWINGGLYDVYGIEGADRFRYWADIHTGKIQEINKEQIHPGMAACYLTGIKDSLEGPGGMYDYVQTERKVFSVGAGNGANVSKIRAKGEPISGGGISEGLIPFLKIPDASAAYIKSGGVTRRAARMLVLDDDHPELRTFIHWKTKEEEKVRAMAEWYLEQRRKELNLTDMPEDEKRQVLNSYWYELIDWRGELYQTVSGQTSNNSIRLSDAFMKAVEEDGTWDLTWRTNASVGYIEKARDLFQYLCEHTWASGDPGVQFGDTINNAFTAPQFGPIVTSNPCSEVVMPDYCSCNLCSINLMKFAPQKWGVPNSLDWDDFRDATKIIIMSLEVIAAVGSHPTAKHAEVTYQLRPLGANIGNLGAYLMANGIPYDSDLARAITNAIVSLFDATCWEADQELGAVVGSYPAYDDENHRQAIAKLANKAYSWRSVLTKQLGDLEWHQHIPSSHGIYMQVIDNPAPFRNCAVTCMVPTGTIGIVMDFDTFGIEPDFSLIKHKSLAGGGSMLMVNQVIPIALKNLGYTEDEVLSITEEFAERTNLNGPPGKMKPATMVGLVKPEHEAVFDCANACAKGRYISVMGHIKMMAAIQDNISMSISKTVNLPITATVEDIWSVYMEAWKLGVKAVAIYRDASKMSQPLTSSQEEPEFTEEVVSEQETIDILNHLDQIARS